MVVTMRLTTKASIRQSDLVHSGTRDRGPDFFRVATKQGNRAGRLRKRGAAKPIRAGYQSFLTSQKNGSGPLTTPVTFFRQAW